MNEKTNRIGGKGSIRRKKKRHHSIKPSLKKNQYEIKFINIINTINTKICELDMENYDIFLGYIDGLQNDFIAEINKKDFKKKEQFIKFRNGSFIFFDNIFIKKGNRIQFNNSLEEIYVFFVKDFLDFMNNFFTEILNILIKKEYLKEKQEINEEFDNITLSEAYNYFDIKLSDEINIDNFKKIYRKMALELHPDKHLNEKEKYEKEFKQLNVYYKFILKRIE
jgi:hypothetical protein